ncbi:MAG: GNAT family N-acetyltransferase [Candidatus Latescibacteria bacterium]|nr:GNAT family N-acetyltransferase [Candidatus Latescibacterota bacterium]
MNSHSATPIPFRGQSDFARMMELVHRAPEQHVHTVDLPYRLSSWAFEDTENTKLWEDANGDILAWAALQTPFWNVDIACASGASIRLYAEILDWAEHRIHQMMETQFGRPCWYITVFSDQLHLIDIFERRGFACQADVGDSSWSQILMHIKPPQVRSHHAIKKGFTIRPLDGERETPAYVDVHRAAFGSENMRVAWRDSTLRRSEYLKDLDLVVISPDDRLAAFCVGWLAESDTVLTGQIEPLGVHPDFQEKGLGRAVLDEALSRMWARGAEEVLVETDSYRNSAFELYHSVGFRVSRDIRVFRKDYG